MNRMKRRTVVSLLLALTLVLVPASGALADTTQDVTVTATPSYISITNAPTTEALGAISPSTTNWALGGETAPADPLVDAGCTFTLTNNSSVDTDIAIQATNFTGGVGWTLAGIVGADTVVMKAGQSTDGFAAMIVVTTTGQAFISALAPATTKKWEFNLATGTFTDGAEKSSTITLTGTAS